MINVSIDLQNANGYEGLVSFLKTLEQQQKETPNNPVRPVLVAILPEYGSDGVLETLECLTVPAEDPGKLSPSEMSLITAAYQISSELHAIRLQNGRR